MTENWIERVAKRASVEVAEANAILQEHGISSHRNMKPAKHLKIRRISFIGKKVGKATDSIDFDWSDLDSGVWVLASHGESAGANLAGKSTVLEIMLWALRGKPKGLQDDVRSWLQKVILEFVLDEKVFLVEFEFEDDTPEGALYYLAMDGKNVIDSFTSTDGFASVMENFMMKELDLDYLPSRRKSEDGGKTIIHGWLALSGAMYFGGDHKSLLGDTIMAGLPGRILQLYIGLPWALPLLQARTAQKKITQYIDSENRKLKEYHKKNEENRDRIEQELHRKIKQIDELGKSTVSINQMNTLTNKANDLSQQLVILESNIRQAQSNAEDLRTLADEDERRLRDLHEDRTAHRFFHGLNPVYCPRCETKIDPERKKREASDLSCAVCAEPFEPDRSSGSDEEIMLAQQRRDASHDAAKHASEQVAKLKSQYEITAEEFQSIAGTLSNIENRDSFRRRRELELEIAKLEGALPENDPQPEEIATPESLKVINAAVVEAQSGFNDAKTDIFRTLNGEVLLLGQNFGVVGLEEVEVTAQAQMAVTKGGRQTTFSKLTSGERLRLRLATAIALLRVGKELNIGRHPGLLIVDSPGSEEIADPDLAKLLSELKAVSDNLPELQVFIATANANAVESVMDKEKCLIAPKGENLW